MSTFWMLVRAFIDEANNVILSCFRTGGPLNPLGDVRKMNREMSCNRVYVSALRLLRSLTILETKDAESDHVYVHNMA